MCVCLCVSSECRCVHGVCDNRPGSSGVCRRGSCVEGYSGDRCDKTATPCNADGLQEHCHINAYCTHSGLDTTYDTTNIITTTDSVDSEAVLNTLPDVCISVGGQSLP